MTKKILALTVALSFLMCLFTSCSNSAKVKINSSPIDNEVVSYFELNLKEGESAHDKIARYVAINSAFLEKGLSVPGSKRNSLSQDVNDLWHLYGEFYKDNGISKETIYKIELSKVYEGLLLEERYSENGASPLKESEIQKYFSENFAAVRFVTGYLFEVSEDETKEMTEEQKTALIDSFKSAAETINNGTDISEAISLLGSPEIHTSVVSSKNDDNLPDGFFDEVKKLEINKASAFTLGSYVFLCLRVDAQDGEYECYSEYRSDCLYGLKGEEFESYINELAKKYK